jgi:hypothetical protein
MVLVCMMHAYPHRAFVALRRVPLSSRHFFDSGALSGHYFTVLKWTFPVSGPPSEACTAFWRELSITRSTSSTVNGPLAVHMGVHLA